VSEISGHGCPEKPSTCMDAHRGRFRLFSIILSEYLENPYDGADTRELLCNLPVPIYRVHLLTPELFIIIKNYTEQFENFIYLLANTSI